MSKITIQIAETVHLDLRTSFGVNVEITAVATDHPKGTWMITAVIQDLKHTFSFEVPFSLGDEVGTQGIARALRDLTTKEAQAVVLGFARAGLERAALAETCLRAAVRFDGEKLPTQQELDAAGIR